MIEPGDTLYRKDTFGPWKGFKVVAGSPGTWILENGERPNKKTLLTAKDRQGYSTRYYTWDAMQDKILCDKNRDAIASAVSVCTDAMTLTSIAGLLGVELKR